MNAQSVHGDVREESIRHRRELPTARRLQRWHAWTNGSHERQS